MTTTPPPDRDALLAQISDALSGASGAIKILGLSMTTSIGAEGKAEVLAQIRQAQESVQLLHATTAPDPVKPVYREVTIEDAITLWKKAFELGDIFAALRDGGFRKEV